MKVVIIGAGIGGLTAAIALKQRGIDCEVYEAAPELKEIGAGIWVPPNAMNVFERLEMAGKIKASGKLMDAICVGNEQGRIFQTITASDVIRKYGNGTTTIHRGRLQKLLYDEAVPVPTHLGKRLTSVADHGDRIEALFADGTTATGELLIGADGMRSTARQHVAGEVALRYSGQTCWRGATDFQLPPAEANRMIEMWGRGDGVRFAYSQMSESQVYFYATACTEAGGTDDPARLKDELKERYRGFGPFVRQIIDSAAVEAIIRTDLFDCQPLQNWTKGRVALLGDAAHASTPNLGQGGAQAVEDGYVIAQCLADYPTIDEALRRYVALRQEKARHVVETSWSYGQMTNWRSKIAVSLRDLLMRHLPARLGERQLERLYRLNY